MELGHSPLLPLRFGSPGTDERLYIISFLKALPRDYIAAVSKSQRKLKLGKDRDPSAPVLQFDRGMTVLPPDPRAPFEFSVFWTEDAKMIKLFFQPKVGFPLPPPDCTRWGLDVHTVIPGQPLLSVSPLVGFDRARVINTCTFPDHHPFRQLCASFMHRDHRPLIEACVLDLIPPAIYAQFVTNQIRNLARADILGFLERVSRGSMKVYISNIKDSSMEPVSEDKKQWLFGVTHVFPWVLYMLSRCHPSCVMADATFYFFKPYICEILHVIVRNESIPIAVAVFPSETSISYLRLYTHVLEVLQKYGAPEELLTKLPFVSDQGTGLRGFIAKLGDEKHIILRWLLCHRHLIENAGASSIVGEWVRSLLLCCTREECIETAYAILLEIGKLDRDQAAKFRDQKNHHLIKNMLAAIKKEFELDLRLDWDAPTGDPFDLPLWARWVREGCPTTSNSAEAIHRWLNEIAATFGKMHFLGRYERLMKYVFDRYEERDIPARRERRSTTRLAAKLKMAQHPLSSRDTNLRVFNLKLHGEDGQPWDEQQPQWTFPLWQNCPGADLKEFKTDDVGDPLPRPWGPDRPDRLDPETAKAQGLLDLDMPDDSNLLEGAQLGDPKDSGEGPEIKPRHPLHPGYHEAAWNIIRCIRRITTERKWKAAGAWKVVIETVFRFGQQYRGTSPTVTDQVTWKFEVLDELGITVVV
jgi:hypothetical protein